MILKHAKMCKYLKEICRVFSFYLQEIKVAQRNVFFTHLRPSFNDEVEKEKEIEGNSVKLISLFLSWYNLTWNYSIMKKCQTEVRFSCQILK